MGSEHTDSGDGALRRTPLYDLHKASGARMVPFAGYEMPIQYTGIIAEHTATRTSAGLFDVSHMGQADVSGPGAAEWLERITPGNITGLKDEIARYTVVTNENGGVVDDLIITRLGDGFRLVVNGARRDAVAAHIEKHTASGVSVDFLDRALIALQGPQAEAVLAPHVAADLAALTFMTAVQTEAFGVPALVSRCGYTGEDGFELSLPPEVAPAAWAALAADPRVTEVGLGARDTLRLEAGLCLYGQDLAEDISPVEAGIVFAIGKRRRAEGGFIGAEPILAELEDGPARQRVGLTVEGRVPVRAGAALYQSEHTAGIVTSGGVGPTVGAPIAVGLVLSACAEIGTKLEADVRGKRIGVTVAALPFVQPNVKRKGLL
ncbi:glycine cleavage system aminomethyltransferase GcvT [Acuticoccus sp. MNP-M23]|uniref:glycine cleavage system aminomethyltransferase GcvT n=1 Tax=Acuticoccus sp. MNP-M23 TaxID=3072793 RepID=UPI002814F6E1|nr:glycine cleavage system aminomethyltransferase GcvT [Acuticoccus sp. MNP-M23]WMS42969.1 glycine cleavage system aminomethyltransferase GcvT [Acuticoccus sp. MNP-M23]